MRHSELARILIERSYRERRPPEEPFVLTSGKTSWHYFECQRTTSHAPALPLIGAAFFERLDPSVVAAGGRTRGADPIAGAIAFHSAAFGGRPVDTFSVRKEAKGHGMKRWVEGRAEAGDRVAVVEDVITTGGSVIEAVRRCREIGMEVAQVLVLVDREEGGLESIRQEVGPGVPVEPLFRFSELQVLHAADRQ